MQRALVAVTLLHPPTTNPAILPACLAALYHAFWVENRSPIGQPAVFGPILAGVLGEEGAKAVLAKAEAAETKKALNENGEEAMREGAFGLPYFVATEAGGRKEAFWGFDHLGQVVDFLGLDREGRGWRAML